MRWRLAAGLLITVFLVALAPVAASAAGLPRGGDYVLINAETRQVVYVGRSGNLWYRLRYWQEERPWFVQKVVVRSDSLAVQKGAEQVLWERYSRVARLEGRQLLNKVSPMNMKNVRSNRNFRENMDYYMVGREYLEEKGLVARDPLDWAPAPLVARIEGRAEIESATGSQAFAFWYVGGKKKTD